MPTTKNLLVISFGVSASFQPIMSSFVECLNIEFNNAISEFLFELGKEEDVHEEETQEDHEEAKDDAVLALTDESAQANPLDEDALAKMQAEQLAQGLEQVQQYQDVQRQEIAAETVAEVVPEPQEVLEAKPA